jgi:prophage maintenance system killer protein
MNMVPLAAALAIRAELVADHGGTAGLQLSPRRLAALEHLLANPVASATPLANPPTRELRHAAVSLAFHLARRPPFREGAGMLALALTDVLLRLNGHFMNMSPAEAAVLFDEAVTCRIGAAEFSAWLAPRCW